MADKKIIPTKLLKDTSGSTTDNSSFTSAKVKAFYFSANWCPPCHKFTPFLAKVYEEVNKNGKELEIVFASLDKSKTEFESYYKKMPWLAVPFDEKEAVKKLTTTYSVRGIPSLIIVDDEGSVLNEDGYLELVQSKSPVEVVKSWKSLY